MGNTESDQTNPNPQPEQPSAIETFFTDLMKPDPNAPVKPEEPSALSTWISNITKPNDATQQQSNQSVQDINRLRSFEPEKPGIMTLNIVKASGFPKKDSTRIELGYSNPSTNSWISNNGIIKSGVHKPSETPIFNLEFTQQYDRNNAIKIIVYGTNKGLMDTKEYVVGSAKLDYQFF